MWRPDIIDLDQFYQSHLGQVARRHLTLAVRRFWPDLTGRRLLGVGYANPFFGAFPEQVERVAALMPANQGVRPWPQEGPNRVFLGDEFEMPLADRSFDRILVAHALESSENAALLLRETWRVLDAGGTALFMTPNRRGLWSRAEGTPFGHGQPYSHGQMIRLLRDSMFQPETADHGLHFPPINWRPLLRANRLVDRVGRKLWPGFGGVHLIEARKQIYAVASGPKQARRKQWRPAPVNRR